MHTGVKLLLYLASIHNVLSYIEFNYFRFRHYAYCDLLANIPLTKKKKQKKKQITYMRVQNPNKQSGQEIEECKKTKKPASWGKSAMRC